MTDDAQPVDSPDPLQRAGDLQRQESSLGTAVYLASLAAAFGLTWWVFSALRRTGIAAQRRQIDEKLQTLRRDNVDPNLRFDPANATLVFERDDIRGRASLLQTHRVYRNSHGAYFLFIATADEPPYFTCLTRERAMDALRVDSTVFRREFPDATDS